MGYAVRNGKLRTPTVRLREPEDSELAGVLARGERIPGGDRLRRVDRPQWGPHALVHEGLQEREFSCGHQLVEEVEGPPVEAENQEPSVWMSHSMPSGGGSTPTTPVAL